MVSTEKDGDLPVLVVVGTVVMISSLYIFLGWMH